MSETTQDIHSLMQSPEDASFILLPASKVYGGCMTMAVTIKLEVLTGSAGCRMTQSSLAPVARQSGPGRTTVSLSIMPTMALQVSLHLGASLPHSLAVRLLVRCLSAPIQTHGALVSDLHELTNATDAGCGPLLPALTLMQDYVMSLRSMSTGCSRTSTCLFVGLNSFSAIPMC